MVGALGGLLLAAAAAADVVERRGSAPVIEGDVTAIDDAGVTVRSPLGAVHFVMLAKTWHAEPLIYLAVVLLLLLARLRFRPSRVVA